MKSSLPVAHKVDDDDGVFRLVMNIRGVREFLDVVYADKW